MESQDVYKRQVVKLIKEAYANAYKILEENKDKLHELAKFLYERETITGEQFMEILNRKPLLDVYKRQYRFYGESLFC